MITLWFIYVVHQYRKWLFLIFFFFFAGEERLNKECEGARLTRCSLALCSKGGISTLSGNKIMAKVQTV